MSTLYPLIFQSRFKERVWGGRSLEAIYGKPLPPGVPIGESWEISDRPGDESVIANGALAGRTLRALMREQGSEILGSAAPAEAGRFPLLCKILDARDRLSLQVHPPARASHLGEPKTEMWYIARADPGAELFVGLKRGVSRQLFEEALRAGRVADCFHRIEVKSGDAMFLPSGRVHAIGAGLVIFEIQQNSDTTFRVDDWNRVGLDGKPRELHVAQSLESIDFEDFEPPLIRPRTIDAGAFVVRPLVNHPLMHTDLVEAAASAEFQPGMSRLHVVAAVDGSVVVRRGDVSVPLQAGDFCLIPASVADATLHASAGARFLMAGPGRPGET
jgi:mannose-6-phosphate isomerase